MAYHTPEIAAITNRHVAKILTKLKEINVPEIALDAVKKEMWFLTDDLIENSNH